MIIWDENLLCSDELRPLIATIKRRLRWRRSSALMTYCITYATNGVDLLDIYNMAEFHFKYYQKSKEELHIIGLAKTREEASLLAGEIVRRVYAETNGFEIESYFENL